MFNFKRFWEGLNIVAKTTPTADTVGDLEVTSSDGKLNYHDNVSSSPVVTEAHVATLTNKTIDADDNTISDLETDNLKAGVLNTDLSAGPATNLQIPSALAVQSFVGLTQDQVDDLVSLTGLPAGSTDLGTFTGTTIPDNASIKSAFQALETGLEDHIADPIDAHDASAISFIPTSTSPSTNVQGAIEDIDDQFSTSGSTGLIFGGVLSVNVDPTKFDLAAGSGWVVDSDDFSTPTRTKVTWSAFTAQTVTGLLSNPVTYISINSAGAIVQQSSFPTPEEKRDNIFIGRLNHQNLTTISFADTFPDILQSEQSQYYDLVDAIGPFNYQGNIVTSNGANLSLDKSSGRMFNASFNYATNNQSPNNVSLGALSPASFIKQTQTMNTGGTVTVIDPANYDVGGVVTAVPGAGTVATVQRVYLFPSNNVRIQYGQAVYTNLAEALASFDSEQFIENPTNTGVAVLVAFIAVTKAATDLSNSTQAKIILAPKFGGATGSASAATTNLQQAYNNSVTPEITTNSSLGALSVKRGSAADSDAVLEVQNGAGTNVVTATGTGDLTAGKVIVDNIVLDASTITGASGLTLSGSTSSIQLGTNTIRTTASDILNGRPAYSTTTSAVTGTSAIVNPGANKIVQLTNASLVSIDQISSTVPGQEVTLVNKTGVDVTINNNSGADGILTGTGSSVTLKANAAFNFTYDSTGLRWNLVGGTGSSTGGGGTTDVDTMFIQNFDTATLGDFTQTGLALVTTNPIHGTAAARLIHQPATSQSFAQTIAVNPKFRGVNVTTSLVVRSTASSGNLTLRINDITNSTVLTTQSIQTNSQAIASLTTTISTTTVSDFTNANINTLRVGMSVTGTGIQTGTTIASINAAALTITLSQNASASGTVTLRFSDLSKTIQLGFAVPDNCASISYTITALQEAGLPETYIDDITMRNYFLGTSVQGQSNIQVTVPNVTAWAAYTPTFTGFGTPTGVEFEWRQVGENVQVRGKFVSGTSTAVEARISLPNSYTSAGTGIIPSISIVGKGSKTGTQTTFFGGITALIEPNVTYFTIGAESSSADGVTKATGSGFITSGQTLSFFAEAPIATLTATSTQSFTTVDIVPAKAVLGNTTLEIPSITDWQSYTPTFQGFGTPTNVEFEWRQVGQDVEVRGKFVAGTTTAVEARVGLPNGYTSGATALIPSIQIAGKGSKTTTSASNFGGITALIEPNVTYFTFGAETSTIDGATKQLANAIIATGNTVTFFAKAPITGLTSTEEIVVSGTQSALIQQPDSNVRVSGSPGATTTGFGTTNTSVARFTTIDQNVGSDILYQQSTTLGDSWTVQSDGIYDMSVVLTSAASATNIDAFIVKNSTSIASGFIIYGNQTQNSAGTNAKYASASGSAYLVAGDVIRVISTTVANFDAGGRNFTMTKQGSLKQVAANADQKITIPTSELRFEGASARGGTDTAIVKFDTLAKIRGDAFTVVNTAANGTVVTVTKPGRLNITTSINASANGTYAITKNQQVLTAFPTSSTELLSTQAAGIGATVNGSATIDAIAGDVIRICSTFTPGATTANNLSFTFQEQSIQVSVSNTLPQFSESDSSLRLVGANGFGSSATTTRRFASVVQNIGTDIQYIDSATLGGQFIAQSNGIYNVTYTELSTANVSTMDVILKLNGTSIAYDQQQYNTANSNGKFASTSWQGYLAQGDIITAFVGTAANNNGTDVQFTMSKVGKPNVTGVDVTPFIQIPQNSTQSSYLTQTATFNNAVITGALTSNTNTGIFSYNATTGIYTILKNCSASFSVTAIASGAAAIQIEARVDGVATSVDFTPAVTGATGTAVYTGELKVGQTLSGAVANSQNSSGQRISLLATAASDQILTAPETFSTDTAALTYAGSGQYTLATLNTAPVGTYITFTYAINTNTRTQTTTRPTQTDADMNANGIQIFTRPYNAASTAAQPAVVAIQIGKGLKGVTQTLYKLSGKATAGSLDSFVTGTTSQLGAYYKEYNEITGILIIDAGLAALTTITAHTFEFSDITSVTSGYLVINASKNPALTGLGLNRIAARGVNTAGTSIPSGATTVVVYDSVKTFDSTGSLNNATGVFTAPDTGYYQVNGTITFASAAYAAANSVNLFLNKNGVVHAQGVPFLIQTAITTVFAANISDTVFLTKGDTLDMRVNNNRTAGATSLATTAGANYFSIVKASV